MRKCEAKVAVANVLRERPVWSGGVVATETDGGGDGVLVRSAHAVEEVPLVIVARCVEAEQRSGSKQAAGSRQSGSMRAAIRQHADGNSRHQGSVTYVEWRL
jgi:hypothetical protein